VVETSESQIAVLQLQEVRAGTKSDKAALLLVLKDDVSGIVLAVAMHGRQPSPPTPPTSTLPQDWSLRCESAADAREWADVIAAAQEHARKWAPAAAGGARDRPAAPRGRAASGGERQLEFSCSLHDSACAFLPTPRLTQTRTCRTTIPPSCPHHPAGTSGMTPSPAARTATRSGWK